MPLNSHQKNDADDDFSSLQTGTMHVLYAQSDYPPSYFSILPRQQLFAKMTKIFHNPFQSYPVIPHLNRHFSRKSNLSMKISTSKLTLANVNLLDETIKSKIALELDDPKNSKADRNFDYSFL